MNNNLLKQFALILWLASISFAQLFQILPLGNSITEGIQFPLEETVSGYRDDLANLLLNDEWDFDFVGSQNDGTGFYPHHEGHPGWTADEIQSNIQGWLTSNSPNIVLFHIGTNDISENRPIQSIIDNINSSLNSIVQYDSSTITVLASPIPRVDAKDSQNTQLVLAVKQLVDDHKDLGNRVYYSPINEAFKANASWANDYMSNYLHPNDEGYALMASMFYQDMQTAVQECYHSFTIAGSVKYFADSTAVQNVFLVEESAQIGFDMTTTTGSYEMSPFSYGGQYKILPLKQAIDVATNNEYFVITSFDAALAMRAAIGLDTLTEFETLAADVDNDGRVLAYDASLIARFAVGQEVQSGNSTGSWVFRPGYREYEGLMQSFKNQDYTAIVTGDVDGSWAAGSTVLVKSSLEMTDPQQYDVVSEGDRVIVKILPGKERFLSLDVGFSYQARQLEFVGVEKINAENWQIVVNHQKNNVRIGAFSGFYESGFEPMLKIVFEQKTVGESVHIVNDYLGIDGVFSNEKFTLSTTGTKLVENFQLFENYPNPFNPTTTIDFILPNAYHVIGHIINSKGQVVKRLVRGYLTPGQHTVTWDGTAENGIETASGVYYFKLSTENESKTIKMLKVK